MPSVQRTRCFESTLFAVVIFTGALGQDESLFKTAPGRPAWIGIDFPVDGQVYPSYRKFAIEAQIRAISIPEDACSQLLINRNIVQENCNQHMMFVEISQGLEPGHYLFEAVLVDPTTKERLNGTLWGQTESSATVVIAPKPNPNATDPLDKGSFIDCSEGAFETGFHFLPKTITKNPDLGCIRRCRMQNVCYDSNLTRGPRFVLLHGPNLGKGSDIWSFAPPKMGHCNQHQVPSNSFAWYEAPYSYLHAERPIDWVEGTTVVHWPQNGPIQYNFFHFLLEDIAGLWRAMVRNGEDYDEPAKSRASLFLVTFHDLEFKFNGMHHSLIANKLMRNDQLPKDRLTCFKEILMGTNVDKMLYHTFPIDFGGHRLVTNEYQTSWTKREVVAFRNFLIKRLGLESRATQVSVTHAPPGGKLVRLGLFVRTNNRFITNHDELEAGLRALEKADRFLEVEVLNFDKLDLTQQLDKVLPFHILMGVHGAGLAHSIFLSPPCAVLEIHFKAFQDRLYTFTTNALSQCEYHTWPYGEYEPDSEPKRPPDYLAHYNDLFRAAQTKGELFYVRNMRLEIPPLLDEVRRAVQAIRTKMAV